MALHRVKIGRAANILRETLIWIKIALLASNLPNSPELVVRKKRVKRVLKRVSPKVFTNISFSIGVITA